MHAASVAKKEHVNMHDYGKISTRMTSTWHDMTWIKFANTFYSR
jgi:hypothetical protein